MGTLRVMSEIHILFNEIMLNHFYRFMVALF